MSMRLAAGEAGLSVLKHQRIATGWWEKFVLGIKSEFIWQREILMTAGQKTCWYARTLIPDETHQAYGSFFGRLQHASLGELIFGEQPIRRAAMVTYPVDWTCMEYYWMDSALKRQAPSLWVRLSQFAMDSTHSFYLIEILLPDLLDATGEHA